jgi:Holliday junction resolvasome RuvABC endonuclease subunit
LKSERVLTLDISTKTGYSVATSSDEGIHLEAHGQIPKVECPDERYPDSYVSWAYLCYDAIEKLFNEHAPDVLVIEETTKSKNSFSQKILEYVHFLVAKLIKETGIKCVYFQTGTWRKEVGSYANDMEKKHNKEVREYKKKNKTIVAYDIKGKRIGLIGKKHVTIRLINEIFGKYFKEPMRKKNEDECDAMALAICYHKQRERGLHE